MGNSEINDSHLVLVSPLKDSAQETGYVAGKCLPDQQIRKYLNQDSPPGGRGSVPMALEREAGRSLHLATPRPQLGNIAWLPHCHAVHPFPVTNCGFVVIWGPVNLLWQLNPT